MLVLASTLLLALPPTAVEFSETFEKTNYRAYKANSESTYETSKGRFAVKG